MAGRFSRRRYATVHNTRRSPVTFNFAAGPFDTFWFAIYDRVRYPSGDRSLSPSAAASSLPNPPPPMICASFSLCVCVCLLSLCAYVFVFFFWIIDTFITIQVVTCAPRETYIYIGWIIIRGFLRLVGKWLVLYVYFLKNEFCRNGSGFSERGEIRGGIGRVLWLDWRKRGKICFKCCVGLF